MYIKYMTHQPQQQASFERDGVWWMTTVCGGGVG